MELPYQDPITTPANLRWQISKTVGEAVLSGDLPEANKEVPMVLVVPWDADLDSDCPETPEVRTTLRVERGVNAYTYSDVSDVLGERGSNASLGDAARAIAHVSDSVFVLCTTETVGPQTMSPHVRAILEDFSRASGVPRDVSDRAWLLRWTDAVELPSRTLPDGWQGIQQVVSDDDSDDHRNVYDLVIQNTEDCLRERGDDTTGRYWYGDDCTRETESPSA